MKGAKTVYPLPSVYQIVGERTPELNEALTCWADLIAHTIRDLEGKLTPDEWDHLAVVLTGKKVRPVIEAPGLTLFHILDSSTAEYPPGLRAKLCDMSFVQEWAIILACRWWVRNRRTLGEDGPPWWTQVYRQAPGR